MNRGKGLGRNSRISRKQSLSLPSVFRGRDAKSFKTTLRICTGRIVGKVIMVDFVYEDVCIEDEINKWWMVLNFLSRKFIMNRK